MNYCLNDWEIVVNGYWAGYKPETREIPIHSLTVRLPENIELLAIDLPFNYYSLKAGIIYIHSKYKNRQKITVVYQKLNEG